MENRSFSRLRIRFFLALLVLAMIIGYVIYSRIVYNETEICCEANARLADDEMRLKVIKSLLATKVAEMEERNENGGQYKTVLVHKRMTEADIIASIKSASILDFDKGPVTYIQNKRDIESLNPNALQDNFAIIQYSTFHREMEIIPGDSIEAVGTVETKKFFKELNQSKLKLSWLERFLGYGNFLYKIKTYPLIHLACCDKLGGNTANLQSGTPRKILN